MWNFFFVDIMQTKIWSSALDIASLLIVNSRVPNFKKKKNLGLKWHKTKHEIQMKICWNIKWTLLSEICSIESAYKRNKFQISLMLSCELAHAMYANS